MPLKGLLAGARSSGCVEGEREKDMRYADAMCFFKKKKKLTSGLTFTFSSLGRFRT